MSSRTTSSPRLLAAGSSLLRRLAVARLHDEQRFGRQSSGHQLRPLHVRHPAADLPRPAHSTPRRRHDRRRLARLRPAVDAVDRRLAAHRGSKVRPRRRPPCRLPHGRDTLNSRHSQDTGGHEQLPILSVLEYRVVVRLLSVQPATTTCDLTLTV